VENVQDDPDWDSFEEDANSKDDDEFNLKDPIDESQILMMIKKVG